MLRIALSPRSVLPRPQAILGSMASSMRRQYSAERELPSNILRSTIYNPNHGKKHCVILHGLMGNRRNWNTFCKRYAPLAVSSHPLNRICKEYPRWTVWAFDLRGHGDSSIIKGDHTVPLLAEDVLRSIHYHNFQVDLLVGFSLGGKVALELDKMMIETHQKLPSHSYIVDPIRHILDTVQRIPQPILGFHDFLTKAQALGLSQNITGWLSTSLKPIPDTPYYRLTFEPSSMYQLLESYCQSDYRALLASIPPESPITILHAEYNKVWTPQTVELMDHYVSKSDGKLSFKFVPHSGHWVHIDNPDFLMDCLKDDLDD